MKFNLQKHLKNRPLSWSAISSFEYSPEQWYKRYILNEKSEETSAMRFGKMMGEKLAADRDFMPEVPRLPIAEYKLEAKIGNIPLIGFIDFYDPKTKRLIELKTGKKWTQEKVDNHGQLDMYLAMLYLMDKVKPEDVEVRLVWLETQEQGHFETAFVKGVKPVIFSTKRTMKDILNMMVRVKKVVKEMEEYVINRQSV